MPSKPVASLVGTDDASQRGEQPLRQVEDAVRRLVQLAQDLSWADVDGDVLVDMIVGGARCVVTASRPSAPSRRVAASAATTLSPREQEIARMVASGYTTKEIASVLEISSWTVSTHLRRVFGK